VSSVVRASAGHMNTERIEVATEFSDRRVLGVITRSDFFRAAAEGFLASG
jgi:hypothetical protein